MPRLNCNVSECCHNSNGGCCLNAIDVQGGESAENTCCASFTNTPQTTNCGTRASGQASIDCCANDCAHNENCQCTAEGIEICNCGSGCSSENTECESFEKR